MALSRRSAELLQLPSEILAIIFIAIDSSEGRKSLAAASRQAQAALVPAVVRLLLSLGSGSHEPEDQNPFRSLHPDVRLKRLTVTQDQQQQLQAGEGSKHLRSQLHAISASPHCSEVEVLHLHQVDLHRRSTRCLKRLFKHSPLAQLHLSDCSIHPASLPYLAACKQLQSLHLDHVRLLPGAEEAFSALAGLRSLKLVMDSVTVTDPASQLLGGAGLLWSVGKCVTHLEYTNGLRAYNADVVALLHMMAEGHLSNLTHLDFSVKSRAGYIFDTEDFRGIIERCAALQHLSMDGIICPDLQTFGMLMAMPALKHLELFAAIDAPSGVPLAPVGVNWPAGKAPMFLRLMVLPAPLLHLLPWEHISTLQCGLLRMELSQQSRAGQGYDELSSILQLLQSKGKVLHIEGIEGVFRGNNPPVGVLTPPFGLSALQGPGCHLQLSDPKGCALSSMFLAQCDLQAVSMAWGSTLVTLHLRCLLTPAAWAALTATSFSRLQKLWVHCFPGTEATHFGVHLSAMCLAWPSDRQLEVVVKQHPGSSADQVVAACLAALQAHGRTQVEVVSEPAEEEEEEQEGDEEIELADVAAALAAVAEDGEEEVEDGWAMAVAVDALEDEGAAQLVQQQEPEGEGLQEQPAGMPAELVEYLADAGFVVDQQQHQQVGQGAGAGQQQEGQHEQEQQHLEYDVQEAQEAADDWGAWPMFPWQVTAQPQHVQLPTATQEWATESMYLPQPSPYQSRYEGTPIAQPSPAYYHSQQASPAPQPSPVHHHQQGTPAPQSSPVYHPQHASPASQPSPAYNHHQQALPASQPSPAHHPCQASPALQPSPVHHHHHHHESPPSEAGG